MWIIGPTLQNTMYTINKKYVDNTFGKMSSQKRRLKLKSPFLPRARGTVHTHDATQLHTPRAHSCLQRALAHC